MNIQIVLFFSSSYSYYYLISITIIIHILLILLFSISNIMNIILYLSQNMLLSSLLIHHLYPYIPIASIHSSIITKSHLLLILIPLFIILIIQT